MHRRDLASRIEWNVEAGVFGYHVEARLIVDDRVRVGAGYFAFKELDIGHPDLIWRRIGFIQQSLLEGFDR